MKGELRFICGIYLPPAVGAGYLIAWCGFIGSGPTQAVLSTDDYANGLPTLAWLFGGAAVLSLVYATVMEMAFDLGIKSGSMQAILVSELLGLLAGVFFHLVVFRANPMLNQDLALEAIGMATGVTVGLVVKLFFSHPEIVQAPREI